MAVTEPDKHELYSHLKETMGEKRATTMMAMVSPTGWADVATKQDLRLLGTELRGEMAELRAELTTEMKHLVTKADFERTLRRHFMAGITINGVFMGLAVTLARLMP